MATGLAITRAVKMQSNEMTKRVMEIVMKEVGQTKNPWFGRANLSDLELRIVLALLVELSNGDS